MENKNGIYGDVPPEKFRLVGPRGDASGTSVGEKSVGYFEDAFRRFKRNKASITALIIIICIVLFAILTPLLEIVHPIDFLEPYYAKMGPRVEWLRNGMGILSGGRKYNLSERRLVYLLALGVAAQDKSGGVVDFSQIDKEYSPILDYEYTTLGVSGKDMYSGEVDSYLEVGFVYMNISAQEYEDILEYEKQSGYAVLFPLINDNEYNPEPANANYWYMADSRANAQRPIYDTDSQGNIKLGADGRPTVLYTEPIEFSRNMQLYDNYTRGADGQPVYYQASGSTEAEQIRVRVLYYNYYRYKNGGAPDYILGTDSQGYDLAARVAGGIGLSLLIAVLVSLINLVIGAVYGAAAGYYGGTVDLVMSRITDILSGVPTIVVQTLFQIHLAERVGVIVSLLFAFVLTGWISTALRVRTQFYRFRGEEYVMSARTLGASDRRIIWRHIFPNTLGTLITASVLVIPGVIFTESMLSFLGIVNLGTSRITSLGTLLSEASGIWTNYPHLMLVPALVISLLMISFNLFGNGLRDAFNPTLRGAD